MWRDTYHWVEYTRIGLAEAAWFIIQVGAGECILPLLNMLDDCTVMVLQSLMIHLELSFGLHTCTSAHKLGPVPLVQQTFQVTIWLKGMMDRGSMYMWLL